MAVIEKIIACATLCVLAWFAAKMLIGIIELIIKQELDDDDKFAISGLISLLATAAGIFIIMD